jgi:hypothetical protein
MRAAAAAADGGEGMPFIPDISEGHLFDIKVRNHSG